VVRPFHPKGAKQQSKFTKEMPTVTYDELCLTTSKELMQGTAAGDLSSVRQPTGLLSGLISDQNTQGVEIEADYSKGGKNNIVALKYLQPDAEADSSDTETNICDDAGSSTAYVWTDVTADQWAQSRTMKLTFAEMRDLCESGSEFRNKIMMNAFDSINRKVNAGLISLFDAGAGGILGGSGATGTEYQMLYTDGLTQVDPMGWINMMRDLNDVGVYAAPILAGGGNLRTYTKLQGISCCNDQGIDPSQLPDSNIYYDNQISTVLTGPSYDNPFFAWAPGAAVFVSRPKYVDQFRMIGDTFIFDTVIDPVTGLRYDFELDFDKCDKIYKLRISLDYGLFQLPLDMFKNSDDRDEVNFNFSFRATEGSAA
jgi:hypothetical protein